MANSPFSPRQSYGRMHLWYYEVAPYVTVNVVFYPRVDAIEIGEHAWQALTPAQRTIIVKAAASTTAHSFVGAVKREREQLNLLCLLHMHVLTATPAEFTGLAKATVSVYSLLERDAANRKALAQIRALKKRTRPAPPLAIPTGCAR